MARSAAAREAARTIPPEPASILAVGAPQITLLQFPELLELARAIWRDLQVVKRFRGDDPTKMTLGEFDAQSGALRIPDLFQRPLTTQTRVGKRG
jgi:hypothetical protein